MSQSFNGLIRDIAKRIDARPHANGLREARLLVEHVTGHSTAAQIVVGDHVVPASDAETLEALVARREAGEPLQRLLGKASFWDFEVALNEATLVPRDDTGVLVEAALELLPKGSKARVVDVGTGSGIIALALAKERPELSILGVDSSAEAVEQARRNAESLGVVESVHFAVSNWLDIVEAPVDMIVSNPPYIAEKDAIRLAQEVREYDPALALFAGEDGLDAYRELLPASASRLSPGGFALFEIGFDQASAVRALGEAAGLEFQAVRTDLAGHDRVIVFKVAD